MIPSGRDGLEQLQDRVSTGERSQGIARAQFRPIFRVGDEQGRGRVRAMEVLGQDQEAQGQAEPGQLCTALERNDQSRPEE